MKRFHVFLLKLFSIMMAFLVIFFSCSCGSSNICERYNESLKQISYFSHITLGWEGEHIEAKKEIIQSLDYKTINFPKIIYASAVSSKRMNFIWIDWIGKQPGADGIFLETHT